jgi:hypothetical protein
LSDEKTIFVYEKAFYPIDMLFKMNEGGAEKNFSNVLDCPCFKKNTGKSQNITPINERI